MKRTKKGQFGYIEYRRTFHLIFALVLFAMAVALYIAGVKTTGSNKNLLTVVAILGVLPASQSTVTSILGFRAKCCSKELFDKIEDRLDTDMISLYDLYFTTYDKNYPINHIVIKNHCVCGIMDESKHSVQSFEQYIEETFVKNGIKGVSFKVFEHTMVDKYLNRIEELKKLENNTDSVQQDVVRLFCDISY